MIMDRSQFAGIKFAWLQCKKFDINRGFSHLLIEQAYTQSDKEIFDMPEKESLIMFGNVYENLIREFINQNHVEHAIERKETSKQRSNRLAKTRGCKTYVACMDHFASLNLTHKKKNRLRT